MHRPASFLFRFVRNASFSAFRAQSVKSVLAFSAASRPLLRFAHSSRAPLDPNSASTAPPSNSTCILFLEIVGARELINATTAGTADPYVTCHISGKEVFRSSIIEDSLNPLFGDSVHLTVPVPESVILSSPPPNGDISAATPHPPAPPIVFTVIHDSPSEAQSRILGVCSAPLLEIASKWHKARSQGSSQLKAFYWLAKSVGEFEKQRKQSSQAAQPGRLGRLYINYKFLTHGQYSTIKDRQRRKTTSSPTPSTPETASASRAPAPLQLHQRPPPVDSSKQFWTKSTCDPVLVPPSQRKFRVLALDGGGVRGILSSTILHRIVQEHPSFLDSVDLITGSSTGGLLSLLLAYGYTPLQCKSIYEANCPEIFVSSSLRRYSLFSAAYSDAPKLAMLKKYFGSSQLSHLSKYVMVTSFRLDGESPSPRKSFFGDVRTWRPALVSNFPRLYGPVDPDDSLSCVDAAMMTSAAPTYFPAHRVQGVGSCYIDGGVFANNPSHVAVTKIQSHIGPRISPANFSVLSVGSGSFNFNIHAEKNDSMDWGLRQWAPHLMNLVLDSTRITHDFHMSMMLGTGYHRLNPQLPRNIPLDAVDDIPELVSLASNIDLSETHHFIENHWFSDAGRQEA